MSSSVSASTELLSAKAAEPAGRTTSDAAYGPAYDVLEYVKSLNVNRM